MGYLAFLFKNNIYLLLLIVGVFPIVYIWSTSWNSIPWIPQSFQTPGYSPTENYLHTNLTKDGNIPVVNVYGISQSQTTPRITSSQDDVNKRPLKVGNVHIVNSFREMMRSSLNVKQQPKQWNDYETAKHDHARMLAGRLETVREACRLHSADLTAQPHLGDIAYEVTHSLAYCRNGKAGTSSLLNLMITLHDPRQTALSNNRLHRVHLYLPTPLGGPPDYHRLRNYLLFTAVRHPFQRLVSAYRDKVINHQYYKKLFDAMFAFQNQTTEEIIQRDLPFWSYNNEQELNGVTKEKMKATSHNFIIHRANVKLSSDDLHQSSEHSTPDLLHAPSRSSESDDDPQLKLQTSDPTSSSSSASLQSSSSAADFPPFSATKKTATESSTLPPTERPDQMYIFQHQPFQTFKPTDNSTLPLEATDPTTDSPIPKLPTFREFALYVSVQLLQCRGDPKCLQRQDVHFRPVVARWNPCVLDFDLIMKVETLDEDIAFLRQELKLPDAPSTYAPSTIDETSRGSATNIRKRTYLRVKNETSYSHIRIHKKSPQEKRTKRDVQLNESNSGGSYSYEDCMGQLSQKGLDLLYTAFYHDFMFFGYDT